MGVSGWVFLLVPAYPGSPGPRAIKRLCVCVCVTALCNFAPIFVPHYQHSKFCNESFPNQLVDIKQQFSVNKYVKYNGLVLMLEWRMVTKNKKIHQLCTQTTNAPIKLVYCLKIFKQTFWTLSVNRQHDVHISVIQTSACSSLSPEFLSHTLHIYLQQKQHCRSKTKPWQHYSSRCWITTSVMRFKLP